RFVEVEAPAVVLNDVRVIDGTGAPAEEGQAIVVRDGMIAWVGAAEALEVPAEAEVLELADHTVLPGFVMLHEHMFYPAGDAHYNELVVSFPRLYLAGGATTIRTGGSMSPYADLNLAQAIEAGRVAGPDIHVTGPYLNGPG
ncbi:MAG: amidohydrolase, partial [Gemmatimonadetes bacterium]|nr:amidohydrolase [Gemmatimonadota bacterium]NIS03085.1 amidohydrolase [Gemmatimonadota bacterium]NIT68833.1 amidohydrolase [Gemmatimonadota bacterium]NIU53897.1 amidohydrolase [Gemmatimonadota bacterium]NIV25469.1 amidohydrolase [Gemmatimonadota bacterium]